MNDIDSEIDCAQKFKVLADDTRLAVLKLLMDNPMQVGEINAVLGLEQSLLSHHLQVLRAAEFVVRERYHKGFVYSLAPSVRVTASKALNLGCCVLWFN